MFIQYFKTSIFNTHVIKLSNYSLPWITHYTETNQRTGFAPCQSDCEVDLNISGWQQELVLTFHHRERGLCFLQRLPTEIVIRTAGLKRVVLFCTYWYLAFC